MISSQPYIIYQLPKSRTTQALKGGKIEKVLANINNFLTVCTSSDIDEPNSIQLIGFSADIENDEFPDMAETVLENAKKVFGNGTVSHVSYSYPQNIPSKQTRTEWSLNNNELTKAINFMIEGQPWPKYNLGPVELVLSYRFKFVDPLSKITLPNQPFDSSFLIWLNKSNAISPLLCFPFETPNANFWQYLKEIDPYLPFKFDNNYLRLVRSNKKGTANIFSKL